MDPAATSFKDDLFSEQIREEEMSIAESKEREVNHGC